MGVGELSKRIRSDQNRVAGMNDPYRRFIFNNGQSSIS